MKTLILSLIFSAVIFAGDAVQTNPLVEKAMASAVADASKAYDAYQAALAKATDAAVVKLTALQTDFTKKGDLDNAVLVKTKIEELKAGKLVEIVAEMKKPVTGADLLNTAPNDLSKMIIGKWKRSDGFDCVFNENGTGTVGPHTIKWKSTEKICEVSFDEYPKWFMRVELTKDNKLITHLDNGTSPTLSR